MTNIHLYVLRYTISPMQFLQAYFQNADTTTEVSRRNYQLLPATLSGSVAEAS